MWILQFSRNGSSINLDAAFYAKGGDDVKIVFDGEITCQKKGNPLGGNYRTLLERCGDLTVLTVTPIKES
ncbi:hypothetical protein [Thermodesulfitimonas autotrophica]|uniref:hypothetical protein n=1 Tax=Thermodesulfitimonas autotrophica TaxID=1894989 RepID=UPI002FE1B4DC